MEAKQALESYAYTSDREWRGTVYTISDIRAGELNGRRVLAELVRGNTVFSWID